MVLVLNPLPSENIDALSRLTKQADSKELNSNNWTTRILEKGGFVTKLSFFFFFEPQHDQGDNLY